MARTVLVTGASSGIGAAAAKALAAQGDIVYGAARRVNLIPEGVIPISMDMTDSASVKAGVERIISEQGRLDILVNNAGYGYFGPVETVSPEEARRQLDVNLFGLAELTAAVLPHMRRQKGGRIVNVASVAGKAVFHFGGWYNVSKFSVEAYSDALRMEVRPFGIKVSIIEPGLIGTDWGLIAARHLQESTAGTAYEEPGATMAANMNKGYTTKSLNSRPEVVSRAIVKACNSRRPRTRYRIGRFSGLIVFFHSLLPARWWDALVGLLARRTF